MTASLPGDSPEPDVEPPVLKGLGERCDHCSAREAVFRILDYRERETGVSCEECLPTFVPVVQTEDGRSWPF